MIRLVLWQNCAFFLVYKNTYCDIFGLTDKHFPCAGPYSSPITCIAGQNCSVIISGKGLQSGDKLKVLPSSCDNGTAVAGILPSPASLVNGVAYNFSGITAVGTYVACWSTGSSSTFNVLIGTFTVQGYTSNNIIRHACLKFKLPLNLQDRCRIWVFTSPRLPVSRSQLSFPEPDFRPLTG